MENVTLIVPTFAVGTILDDYNQLIYNDDLGNKFLSIPLPPIPINKSWIIKKTVKVSEFSNKLILTQVKRDHLIAEMWLLDNSKQNWEIQEDWFDPSTRTKLDETWQLHKILKQSNGREKTITLIGKFYKKRLKYNGN